MASSTTLQSQDDDLIIVENPIELIIIDEDDDANQNRIDHLRKQFHLTEEMKQLIEHIKLYPDLFDNRLPNYNDGNYKGRLWNKIASEMNAKAAKLMKIWIVMQTRFEWVTNLEPSLNTELENGLEFLKYFISTNENTVCKQSYFLKENWHNPIEIFKNIQYLLSAINKHLQIIPVTESLLTSTKKSTEYLRLWFAVANESGVNTIGECEVTWLILRLFYWELKLMRHKGYQLLDKWYFESMIDELYQNAFKLSNFKKSEIFLPMQLKKQSIRTYIKKQNNALKSLPSSNSNITNTTTINLSNSNSPVEMLDDVNTSSQQSQIQISQAENSLPKIISAISLNTFWDPTEKSDLENIPSSIVAPVTTSDITTMQPPLLSPESLIQDSNDNVSSTLGKKVHQVEGTSIITAPIQTELTVMATVPTETSLSNSNNDNNNNINDNSNKNNDRSSLIQLLGNETPQTTLKTDEITPLSSVCKETASSNINIMTTVPIENLILPLNEKALCRKELTVPSSISKASVKNVVNIKPTTVIAADNQIAVTTTPCKPSSSTIRVTTTTTMVTPKLFESKRTISLSPKEILIELIASPNGNLLVIHGPPLSQRYSLTMSTTVEFIRQVMAIPLLHNKKHDQPSLINSYWNFLSQEFKLPSYICRACWNFLLQNFSQFPKIAPMKEIMKPFHTKLNVWKKGKLFNGFESIIELQGWLKISRLPEIIECIGTYPVLYRDVCNAAENTLEQNDMEWYCAWRTIRLRFRGVDDISEIWKVFKVIFIQYIKDIENGINNSWPLKLWRILAKMKFLVEARYSNMEPFYYIVHNEILNEIERCAMLEMLSKYDKNAIIKTNESNKSEEVHQHESNCTRLQSDKEVVILEDVNQLHKAGPVKQATKSTNNSALEEPSQNNLINLLLDKSVAIDDEENQIDKLNSVKQPMKRTHNSITENPFNSNCKKLRLFEEVLEADQKQPTINNATNNDRKKLPKEIEANALLSAINKMPIIYDKWGDPHEKYEAWTKVAKILNVEVTDCMSAFRFAILKFYTFKRRDPLIKSFLNQRYYAKYNEFRRIVALQKRNQQKYQQVEEVIEIDDEEDNETNVCAQPQVGRFSANRNSVFPERYIADINLHSCPINLVVKNLCYALDNICTSIALSEMLKLNIRNVLRKLIPNA